MPTFSYRATAKGGEPTQGSVEAADRKQALQRLHSQGLRVTDLRLGNAPQMQSAHNRADPKDKLALAAKQLESINNIAGSRLATAFLKKLLQLHGSGLPLGDAVKLLSQRAADPLLAVLTGKLWRDLSEGRSLALSLSQYPRVFDSPIIHLIEAGESTGNLCPVLANLIESLEESAALRKRILGGMAYPALICSIAFGIACLFAFYLQPRIQGMMEQLGQKMSLPARILAGLSEGFIYYGPFILGALVIGALSIHRWRKTPEGRRKTDEWILKIPIVGKICRNIDVCRMTNLTSTLIESGVNTTEALRMTERSIQNTVLRENFSAARIMINDGAAFSLALRKHAVLDDTDLDILSIGESTGNIARSFKEIFKNHTQDLDSEFKILIRTVAGVAMGSAFGLVALLALGIVTSVLQLSQSIMAR